MLELLEAAILPINIVFTILLAIVLLYWVSVILGALDISTFDVDIEADVDIDMDADLDADVDGGHSGGWFIAALSFFNFGKVPFMVVMTFLILSMWAISILTNHYLGGGSALFALGAFIPNLCISLIVTKIATSPLVPIFRNFNKTEAPVDYIGKTCTLVLPATTTEMGQAEVEYEGKFLLVSVKVEENDVPVILRKEKAVIVGEAENGKYYFIRKSDVEEGSVMF